MLENINFTPTMLAGLFVCIFVCFCSLIMELLHYRSFQGYVIDSSISSSAKRIRTEEEIRNEEGAQEKVSFLYLMDLLLEQSGLKKYFPIINTELYIGCIVFMAVLSICIGSMKGNFIVGFGIALALIVVMYGLLEFLATLNYKNTEKSITQFANLIQSYAMTTNDIIAIFGSIYIYLSEPLKSALKGCYDEAHTTGDISYSLNHLEKKINHPMFELIVHNLEICSRHEANYSELIVSLKKSLQDYMRNKEEVKAMVDSGRSQIIMLLALGTFAIYILNSAVETSVVTLLTTTYIGKIMLCVILVLVFIVTMIFISFGGKKR